MGRYYSGDIEGKFWFAVQSSDTPERFGGRCSEILNFEFSKEEDYEGVCKEIEKIEKNLGEYKVKFDEFFKANDGYNNDMLIKAGFPADKVNYLLEEYADLELGLKIKKCLEEQDYCCFEEEC